MLVKKYKAQITDSDTEIIGYLIEQRESIGNGCYSNKIQYLIVTKSAMVADDEYVEILDEN